MTLQRLGVRMIRLFSFMGLFALFACGSMSAMAANASHAEQYRLGAGDKISILVRGEKELTMTVVLNSTGIFSYPYLGKINVLGKTVMQVEDIIRNGLSGDYLLDPYVEVSIAEHRPFFINGEVNKPGEIPYQPGLTLRRAITLASGLSERADTDKIFVIRQSDSSRTARKIQMDDPVYPGDSITVETSYFFVTGEVRSRGKYPYHAGLTFRMAVTLAGGFTERADTDELEVVRTKNGKTYTLNVKPDGLVHPRDVITVNQSFF